MLYILKSDTPELEYQIFGIYENLDKLLQGANNVFKGDEWLANKLQNEYKFSELVFYPFTKKDLNKNNYEDHKVNILWNSNKKQSYINPETLSLLKSRFNLERITNYGTRPIS